MTKPTIDFMASATILATSHYALADPRKYAVEAAGQSRRMYSRIYPMHFIPGATHGLRSHQQGRGECGRHPQDKRRAKQDAFDLIDAAKAAVARGEDIETFAGRYKHACLQSFGLE